MALYRDSSAETKSKDFEILVFPRFLQCTQSKRLRLLSSSSLPYLFQYPRVPCSSALRLFSRCDVVNSLTLDRHRDSPRRIRIRLSDSRPQRSPPHRKTTYPIDAR